MKNKLNFLLLYTDKSQLSKYLEISRKTFYNKLKTGDWKQYQIDKINHLYNLAKENSKTLLKITIDNFTIMIHSKTYIIYRTISHEVKLS